MNKNEYMHSVKLSYLTEEDGFKAEENVRRLLEYAENIPVSEKEAEGNITAHLRMDIPVLNDDNVPGMVVLENRKND